MGENNLNLSQMNFSAADNCYDNDAKLFNSLPYKSIIVGLDKENKKVIKGNAKNCNWTIDQAKKKLSIYKDLINPQVKLMINLTDSNYFCIDVDNKTVNGKTDYIDELFNDYPVFDFAFYTSGTTKGYHFFFEKHKNLKNKVFKKIVKVNKKYEIDLIPDHIIVSPHTVFQGGISDEYDLKELHDIFDSKPLQFVDKSKIKKTEIIKTETSVAPDRITSFLNNKLNFDFGDWIFNPDENKFFHQSLACVCENSATHSVNNHSCLYFNEGKYLVACCHSHPTKKIKITPQEAKELRTYCGIKNDDDILQENLMQERLNKFMEEHKFVEEHGERFISLSVLRNGSYDICETILPDIKINLVFCNNRWIVYDKGLWNYISEPSLYIQKIIRYYIACSIKLYNEKLLKTSDEQEHKKINNDILEYASYYNSISKNSFIVECTKLFKSYLLNDEFANKLDCNKYMIAFQDGVLDLKTLTFRTGINYDDYITQTLPFKYQPKRDNEKENFVLQELKKICNYNDTHLKYYLSVLGYSLLGDAEKEKAMYYLIGQQGNNGKTLFLDVLSHILPTYVQKADSKVLEQNYSKKHKILPSFKGKRIIWCDEFEKKAKLDIKMMKEIADGKTICNEVMFGTNEIINVNAKMFIVSNHTPNFDADGGVSNRYRQLQFNSHFHLYNDDDFDNLTFKIDVTLADKLKNDYANDIINILIEYAHKYCSEGLEPMPDEYKEITNDTLEANNEFKNWFENNCIVDESSKTLKHAIMDIFPNKSIREINDELLKLGFKYNKKMKYQNKQCGGWKGFSIIDDE
jgi:phage/plasmid-associated DNA primase